MSPSFACATWAKTEAPYPSTSRRRFATALAPNARNTQRNAWRTLALIWLALAGLSSPCLARAEALLELRLTAPPHAPHDAPDVLVHLPSQLDTSAPVHLLIFLHGFSSCVRALAASQPVACSRTGAPQRPYGLAQLHEQSPHNSILVIPQLAFLARDADAKRFAVPGGFDAFLDELLSGPLRKQLGTAVQPSTITLLAHSAGYRAAATILRDPQRRREVHHVVLFDALYAHWDVFARWYQQGDQHRLLSFYTNDRQTTLGHTRLRALLGPTALRAQVRTDELGATGQPSRQSSDARITLRKVSTLHGLVPQRHLEEALRALFGAQNAH